MTPAAPIVLIGPMAAGKSAVGHELAALLGATFADSDRLIVQEHGPIAQIFASHGERYFREREAAVIADLLQPARRPAVVALGGGAVLDAGTAQLLQTNAVVVYLRTDVQTVLPRISGRTSRPLLAENPAEAWVRLFEHRRPVYEQLADVIVESGAGTVRETAEQVRHELQERNYVP